eukprot:jgi/Tetstr1/457654/TSEL_004235.t1
MTDDEYSTRNHLATEEATRSRLGYLKLAKNGLTATEADQAYFAELAPAKLCAPRSIAVSGQLATNSAERSTTRPSRSAGKARAAAAFAKATPDKPIPTESAEKRKQREQSRSSAEGRNDGRSGRQGQGQVPKPGTHKWRLIIDLRELNKWCKTLKMSYETLKHPRHPPRAGG